MTSPRSSSAVMVMPRETTAWPTAQALWITARGWAEAARQRFGHAWIVTPDGTWEPSDFPAPHTGSGTGRSRARPLPILFQTLLKDLRLRHRQGRFQVPAAGPWSGSEVNLVWEHHDLFNHAGRSLAAATGAPLVRYVHAPQVWEAAKWGVRRPIWGRVLEAGERRRVRDADLVACVSRMVRDQLVTTMGVEPARVVVAPMGVDADIFSPRGDHARTELGISATALVMGWSGSFRPFHGLDLLMDAFAIAARECGELRLLLIGDGPSRRATEVRAADLGIADRVTFAGVRAHSEMPALLRAMDIAVVSSDGRGGFHYSPLKLREYAACGLPVVAPDEGEMQDLADTGFVTVHKPGDHAALAAAFLDLASDASRRKRRGSSARAHALEHWTWQAQLERVVVRLAELGLGPQRRPATSPGRTALSHPAR